MEATLTEILAARDKRAERQKAFLSKHRCPLISFTMNIAGPVKTSPLIERGFAKGYGDIAKAMENFHIKEQYIATPHTGCEALIAIEGDSTQIKKLCVEIEESSPLGRLFDIDVIDESGVKLDRRIERSCIVCGEPGKACSAGRLHPIDEIQSVTTKILKDFFKDYDGDRVSKIAVKSLIDEVNTTPKPGLVDRRNNGSHTDMDVDTFIKSANALAPYFKECFILGAENKDADCREFFEMLRKAGIKAEAEMYRATGGVNTHKGIIYSLGIICGAIGRSWSADIPFGNMADMLRLCGEIASCTAEDDLKKTGNTTAGGKAYIERGISGIRGEASSGFETVSKVGLPTLKTALADGLDHNTAGVYTLLMLMTNVPDTNLYKRGGEEGMKYAMQTAKDLTVNYPDTEKVKQADDEFIKRNLSPGGCADLLAITYFLNKIYN